MSATMLLISVICFLVIFSTASSGQNEQQLKRQKIGTHDGMLYRVNITNAASRLAVANDGSDGIFYFSKGSVNKNASWLIYLEGGFYCATELQCAGRWKSTKALMSSTVRPATISGSGIWGNNPSVNPFYDFNVVYVPYLTSDFYIGNASASESKTSWQFRGRPVLTAVIEELFHGFVWNGTKYSIPKNEAGTNILLTGSSAGGIGALLNANYVADLIHAYCEHCKYSVAPDSGYFVGVVKDPFAEPTECQLGSLEKCPIRSAVRLGTETWKSESLLDAACVAEAKALKKNPSDCMYGSVAVNFVRQRAFYMEYGFDAVEFSVDGCSFFECVLKNGGAKFVEEITLVKRTSMLAHPSFMPSCWGHMIAVYDPTVTGMPVKNVTLTQALREWYFEGSNVSHVDKCDTPFCRSQCVLG